jgi:tetratricopeptide (TPR) repeat protein
VFLVSSAKAGNEREHPNNAQPRPGLSACWLGIFAKMGCFQTKQSSRHNITKPKFVKVRLLLVFAVLFVFSYGVSAYRRPSIYSQQIIARATPTATLTPSQSNKPRISITKLTDDLEVAEKNVTRISLILVKVVAALLSLLILYRIILMLFQRSSQLIVDNFINASDADEMDKVLPGLSQLARERLVGEMKGVRQRVKEHIINQGPETYHPPDKLPLPQTTPDQRLGDLVTSLSEFTPDQMHPAMNMLKAIFPPFGTKVTSILQSQGKEYNRLGITFEITNIQGRLSSKLYTVWESVDNSLSEEALKDRYRKLLGSAIRWLALELSRREMVAAVPWYHWGRKRDRYQAKIYNFFGALNLASAPNHGKLFYDLAIEDLQQAIVLYPEWFQPYENLADTYSTFGREISSKESINWQRQAILQYDRALHACEDESVKRRIRIGKAMAGLITGDVNLTQEAKDEIENLRKRWDETSELNTRFLYNLAAWYAIAYRINAEVKTALSLARRYFVYALLRDYERTLWEWAGKDPDLQGICKNYTELKFLMLKKLNEVPELPSLTGNNFTTHAEEVLKALGTGDKGIRDKEELPMPNKKESIK